MSEPTKKKGAVTPASSAPSAARAAVQSALKGQDRAIQLDDLDVFVRVFEAESMSAVARLLGVPKSTVSRAVSRLEDAMKVRLLQRTSRALSPTDAGRALFEEAQPHVHALRSVSDVVSAMVDTPRGALRVTAPNDLGEVFLAGVFTRFVARYPDVSLDVVLTPRTVDLVAEGFDVAIRAGTLRDSSLVARKVGEADGALVASAEYVARRGAPRTLEELPAHDHVVFRGQRGRARYVLEPSTRERGERVTVDVHGHLGADDFSFVRSAVLAGGGIGLVPMFMAQEGLRDGKLVRILPDWAWRDGAFYLVHASGRHVPRKIAVFREFLVEAFKSLPTCAGHPKQG
jgi:DNA-binding transcriptional LysR family regulator